MKNKYVKTLAFSGMYAALYIAITLAFGAFSFGSIQCRLSTMLVFLIPGNQFALLGFIAGTALANLFSPLGVIDAAYGLATAIAGGLAIRAVKHPAAVCVVYPLISGAIVGMELSRFYGIPYFAGALSVCAGNFISCVAGAIIWSIAGTRLQGVIDRLG